MRLDSSTVLILKDLIVRSAYRGQRIGTKLLQEAEQYALWKGLRMIKIGSLSRNYTAKELDRKLGYRDYAVQLIKEFKL